MNILVCLSKVPDTTSKISFTDNNTRFNTQGVQFILNPSDEWYALVRAIEIKESLGKGSVAAVMVGGAEDDSLLRKAVAIGADTLYRINAQPQDAYSVARMLADFIKGQSFDLVMTGRETIDYNGGEVPAMLAELLGWELVSPVNKLDIIDGKVRIESELGALTEVLECDLPLVVSAAKGLADQRIPNMWGIRNSRLAVIHVIEPSPVAPLTRIVKFDLPPAKGQVKMIPADQPELLVKLLHEEAKVI
ncbi:MAG: electron transfer flavoprotein subunit beta/FixA family protein [Flavobacteriales bacterium]|nr:electron transfer flavoprotein subunit beta/FixA family protein [Flavobacteriales bacterium]MCX7767430.1 electron transfer flavoprotein subunit beta/FixA family protein [Flavobacteriales bacterium]MDW8410056.1 electron transfer flavoprotein subunit beta/FixA family protein [Flavobacteriales bacterium]